DADDNFIANQTATWDETGTLDNVSASGASYTFSPSTADTSGTITADAGGGMTDATGTITVNAGALDYIVICTDANGQNPAGSHTMTTDDTWTLWAAGYDAEDNFRGNETATWDQTGTLDDVSGSGTSYTFSPSTAGTSGTITADADGKSDGTGTIMVNIGALHHIVIEDAADGTGSEVGTHTMIAGETFQVWAAGYDTEHNYIGDISVAWSGTGVVAGRLAPASGISTTFTAGETGTGTIHADHPTATDDDTGTITVNPAALSYMVIEDTAGGTGSEVGTHTMASGQTFQVWAAGYDAYDNYISDVAVTWSGTGVVAGRLAPTTGSSTIFTAGETGTGTIHADDGSGHTDDTGTITVSDLTVSKIDLPDPVPAGGELTYIINYQNGVTSPAEDVIITETYDSRVTFVSATLTPTMGT
ncbi:MAG: hypothetical protein KAX26_07470, partial [Anaerolineae bacterium]|nr:hypothetical protein [Anaerolineae bacterium]